MRNVIAMVCFYFNKYNSSKLKLGVDNGEDKEDKDEEHHNHGTFIF
jgi:hypothetical protein